jgi:hypothetical protein
MPVVNNCTSKIYAIVKGRLQHEKKNYSHGDVITLVSATNRRRNQTNLHNYHFSRSEEHETVLPLLRSLF